jgi:tetratricopeptide (TPR) repeat protein
VEYLRKATELDPRNAMVWLDLGIALYRTGSAGQALEPIKQALQVNPHYARAHYAAGMLMAMAGHDREAIDAFLAATTDDTHFVEAHISLAQALQRTGRQREALAHYQAVLTQIPADSEGQFGSAITLVRLGQYQDARVRLTEGMDAHPDETRFAHALARVLAAAPDDRIRDGQRARSIAETLLKLDPTIDRAETLAMALAELGRFDEAIAWQRHTIAEIERGGGSDEARQMGTNLRLYERGQPCRTPWRADDPIFSPSPPTNPAP